MAEQQKSLGEATIDTELAEQRKELKELLDPLIYGDIQTPPLLTAATKGNVGLVVALLDKFGADKNVKDTLDETPLMKAAWKGHLPVVETLLAAGANVDIANNRIFTALHAAANRGYAKIVDALLKKGANKDARDNTGGTPLMEAAYHGRLPAVKTLLAAQAGVNITDAEESTALIGAAYKGHDEVVNTLLESGAEKDARQDDGFTPLLLAAQEGHLPVVHNLLGAGVGVHIRTPNGRSSLHVASQEGHHEIAKALLDAGADKDARDNDGVTPLTYASGAGHLPVVITLLAADSNVNNLSVRNDRFYGHTALHAAAQNGRNEVVRVLLRGGADVNRRGDSHETPLMVAVYKGYLSVVEKLLAAGADVTIFETEAGYTALHYAASNNRVAHVSLLLRWGADENTLDKNNKTPADLNNEWEPPHDEGRDNVDRVRLLLARAPADRAWRRRGWLVVLRSRKERESGGDGRDEEALSAKRQCGGGEQGQCFDFFAVVPTLAEGVFRNVVSFL